VSPGEASPPTIDDKEHDVIGHNGQAYGGDELGEPMRRAVGHRLLTASEEIRLAKRIERGDLVAKQQMIESNLRLVLSLATRYRGRGVPYEDLVQEGTVGLVRAVEKFDHRRGLKFSTYAVWWIRRSLMDALGSARTIRMPRSAGQQLAAIHSAEADLRRLGEGPPTAAAVAERTGLSVAMVQALRDAAVVTASLDEPVGDDATPLGQLIADRSGSEGWQRTVERETSRQVCAMLPSLSERHREVLVRRYGLGGEPVQSHHEIGAFLGVGYERSRQLEHEALRRLRELDGGHQRRSHGRRRRETVVELVRSAA
jgi:RNA polymerase primary sigma factor